MGSFTRLLRVMEKVRLVAWMVASGRVFFANGNQDGDDTVATLMFKQMEDVRTESPPPGQNSFLHRLWTGFASGRRLRRVVSLFGRASAGT